MTPTGHPATPLRERVCVFVGFIWNLTGKRKFAPGTRRDVRLGLSDPPPRLRSAQLQSPRPPPSKKSWSARIQKKSPRQALAAALCGPNAHFGGFGFGGAASLSRLREQRAPSKPAELHVDKRGHLLVAHRLQVARLRVHPHHVELDLGARQHAHAKQADLVTVLSVEENPASRTLRSSLIVLPKSCSCRWGPCPRFFSLSFFPLPSLFIRGILWVVQTIDVWLVSRSLCVCVSLMTP